jgi:hypothetical protein
VLQRIWLAFCQRSASIRWSHRISGVARTGNGRLGRSSYVLTLTTYADYIPEQETENPLPEPVAAVAETNVITLHRAAQSGS